MRVNIIHRVAVCNIDLTLLFSPCMACFFFFFFVFQLTYTVRHCGGRGYSDPYERVLGHAFVSHSWCSVK